MAASPAPFAASPRPCSAFADGVDAPGWGAGASGRASPPGDGVAGAPRPPGFRPPGGPPPDPPAPVEGEPPIWGGAVDMSGCRWPIHSIGGL
ncbi:hypothetical protein EI067_11755 [Mycobacterium paragordonae]|nr:hypothetical protein EI067_11755 [Mycobacterium paragordonae]